MTQIFSNYDLQHLRRAYPELGIEPLSSQEERVLLYIARGMTLAQASSAAGISVGAARKLAADASFDVALTYVREINAGLQCAEIKVTRDTLTRMLFDAHSKSATATEEIAAIRELGKMHDLYLDAQRKAGVEINITSNIQSSKQLERLDDHLLIELAGESYTLEPSNDA